jgi:2-dehydro-3-deoxygluconokinase
VGSGDSFAAGIIHGLLCFNDKQKTIEFAVATSALKHTIFGDFNQVSEEEVFALMNGDASGRVAR